MWLSARSCFLTPEGITSYDGGYDEFTEMREEEKAKAQEAKTTKAAEPKQNAYEERKQQESERRKLQNRLTKVERLIEEAEGNISELKKEYENPELATVFNKLGEITAQIDSLNQEIEDYMEEWETLQEALETK